MPIKLLVTSDLHLGRRSSGLPEPTDFASAETSWNRIVEQGLDHKVDAVLLAGDLIDQENYFFESVGPLVDGVGRLADQQIPVFMVVGNHDYGVLGDAFDQMDSEQAHLLGTDGKWERKVVETKNGSFQIFGRSFTDKKQEVDPLTNFDKSAVDADLPSVGMVHGQVDAADMPYGPIDRELLLDSGLDAWFIGHIHRPQILRDHQPLICYPGSPHAFSIREEGPHGPWIAESHEDRTLECHQIPTSPVRYEILEVDVSETEDKHAFRNLVYRKITEYSRQHRELLEEVSYVVVDVVMKGRVSDPVAVRDWSEEVTQIYEDDRESQVQLSVRKVKTDLDLKIGNVEELANQKDPVGILADFLVKLQNEREDERIDELVRQWKREVERANRSGVYQPLRSEEKLVETDTEKARNHIEQECERLLLELMRQRNHQG